MIRFPKMHVARSVTNRILNIADEIDAGEVEAVAPIAAPSIPETSGAGLALDVKLATPPGEVAAPDPMATEGLLQTQEIL
jgi:hypothetical protein